MMTASDDITLTMARVCSRNLANERRKLFDERKGGFYKLSISIENSVTNMAYIPRPLHSLCQSFSFPLP